LANSILIEGHEGSIIVDTLESVAAARAAKQALIQYSTKPVKAIIYTHNHADHVAGTSSNTSQLSLTLVRTGLIGAQEFVPSNESLSTIHVYSHASTLTLLDQTQAVTGPITYKRAMRQFGVYLRGTDHVNSGIGPKLLHGNGGLDGLIRPNKVFEGKVLEVEIEGVHMQLIHAPGETDDQIVVWLPKDRVLLAADNFYKVCNIYNGETRVASSRLLTAILLLPKQTTTQCFPNLYAIRGTPHRDTMQWVQSIDEMRALQPGFMKPLPHSSPITM